jgi:dTDP-4-dehydrorhamnose reductase
MARSKLPESLVKGTELIIRPPYEVDDEPDPLQMYGRQKRDGEIAVLKEREGGARVTVLRVPLL